MDDGTEFGCMIRKILFVNVFADRKAAISSNPIPAAAMKHLKVRTLKNSLRFFGGKLCIFCMHVFSDFNIFKPFFCTFFKRPKK